MSAIRLLAICATGLSVFGCLGGGTANSADPSTAEPATILAVGDIAQCGALPAADSAAARTAAVVDGQAPDLPLLLLGDLVYNSGTLAEYLNCYAPTYGKFMARSFPAPGNHDYGVPAGDDYYSYFGARAGPDKRGYYSFDVGSWHIVSLNSNIDMAKGSAQEAWLRADLAAASSKKCTLAYWHHPRFSSSSTHGDDPRSSDIWRVLLEFGADVVLVGHDHTYERFAPQDADANADPPEEFGSSSLAPAALRCTNLAPPSPTAKSGAPARSAWPSSCSTTAGTAGSSCPRPAARSRTAVKRVACSSLTGAAGMGRR